MTDFQYSSSSTTPGAGYNLQPAWLSQVQLRLLNEADLPALEWDGEYTHFRRLYQDVYRSVCQGDALMWGADLPGQGVIGQAFVQLASVRSELADGLARCYLYGFRVRPAYRGAGLGTRLMQVIETDMVKRGYLCVTLNVGRYNLAARGFYERRGYQVVAPEPGRWSYLDHEGRRREVNEPAWRMEKKLYPGV